MHRFIADARPERAEVHNEGALRDWIINGHEGGAALADVSCASTSTRFSRETVVEQSF